MPGYLLFDFADAIRTGISTELEDSKKIENIDINVEYYKEFVNGFLENILPMISYDEISMLVDAVKVITYECALRFMTDYLNGDQYFKIDYDEHNLIRSKNQIMLLKKIIQKEQDLKNIVNECVKNIWKKASF